MFLIDRRGQRVRPVCRECRAIHKPQDCPLIEGKILAALGSGGIPGGSREIAAALGVPLRRVQQTVGRLLRNHRRRLG